MSDVDNLSTIGNDHDWSWDSSWSDVVPVEASCHGRNCTLVKSCSSAFVLSEPVILSFGCRLKGIDESVVCVTVL